MNTGPSITCIVGMLFHWLQKWLTSFKYFTHFFPPHIWHSEQIIRWFTTEGITCDSFILFSTGVASQNVPAVDATPTSTHLHPGVGFPLWNSRLPFVFLPQIREHWTAGFCNETVHSPMCCFLEINGEWFLLHYKSAKLGNIRPVFQTAEQLRCDLTVTGHLACCKLYSVWHQRNKQTIRSICKRVKKNVCFSLHATRQVEVQINVGWVFKCDL